MNYEFLQTYSLKKLHLILGVIFMLLLGACTPKEEEADDISVDSVSPASGDVVGGYTVKILGSNFTYIESVKFGASDCKDMSINKNEISCTAPEVLSPGPVTISIKGKAKRSATASFTYILNAPSVTSFYPESGPLHGGASIFVYGSGFTETTTVSIGGTPCAGHMLSSTIYECITPVKVAGSYTVVVINTNGLMDIAPALFTYNPNPSVTAVTPNFGSIAGGTTITITGTNFISGAKVNIENLNCPNVTFVNSTTLTCVTPVSIAGAHNVKVINPDTQFGTMAGAFTYINPAYINGISPVAGSLLGGTTLTINGTNFMPTSTVEIDGTDCPITFVNSTKITVVTPPKAQGKYIVSVRNPGTQEDLYNGYTFQEAPTLTSISPQVGPLAGDTDITIIGTFFRTGAKVTVGTVDCRVKSLNATTIVCETGVGTAGTFDVTVTNTDNQTDFLPGAFSYQGAPTIATVTPDVGTTNGGTAITITGTNFFNSNVTIGGSVCNITSITPSSIDCVTTSNSTGEKDIIIVNDDAQEVTMSGGYEYIGAPALSFVTGSVSPNPPNPDDFGSTSVNVTHTYTINNTGELPSTLVLFSITGANPTAFSIGTTTCLGSLAVGDSCTVQVNFEGASLSSGSYNAVLEATPSSGVGATNTIQGTVP